MARKGADVEIQTVLEMESLDVTAGTWEDLKREVLADDPEAVAPLFVGDSRKAGVFLCGGCAGCACAGCGIGSSGMSCSCVIYDCLPGPE
jgi:hypothetical protein